MKDSWLTDSRFKRIEEVVNNRKLDLTIILENVHDPHNIGAVLRTCDSIGISEVYLLYNSPQIKKQNLKKGRLSSTGADKWIEAHEFHSVEECMKAVKEKYGKIYGTYLGEKSQSLYEIDMTNSMALMFGNEHTGISEEALAYLDGNFIIPQVGFVKSLNISVACAVTLYEAFRQRSVNKRENSDFEKSRKELLQKYISISRPLRKLS